MDGAADSCKACSRSLMMSFGFSMPMERRTSSGGTPPARISSSDICEWVVVAGLIASVLASPTLATWLISPSASMNLPPASLAAKDHHGPTFALQILLVEVVHWVIGQAGVAHPLHTGVSLEVLGHRQGVRAVLLHA